MYIPSCSKQTRKQTNLSKNNVVPSFFCVLFVYCYFISILIISLVKMNTLFRHQTCLIIRLWRVILTKQIGLSLTFTAVQADQDQKQHPELHRSFILIGWKGNKPEMNLKIKINAKQQTTATLTYCWPLQRHRLW